MYDKIELETPAFWNASARTSLKILSKVRLGIRPISNPQMGNTIWPDY